jgi:hypothetical protein
MLTGTHLEVDEIDSDENETTHEELASTQEMIDEEDPGAKLIKAIGSKEFKIGAIVGTLTATFTYCVGYGLSYEPWVASIAGGTPAFFMLCASPCWGKGTSRPLGAFVINGAVTNLLNTLGATLPLEAYPLIVPIVSFNLVTCTNILTPALCVNLPKMGQKISDSCFSLWERVSSRNKEEGMPLQEFVVENEKSNFAPGR